MALQHLRSSTAHKRPIPTVMSAGQIAINTNEASPALFFKDSNGDLVKVGPVHIGPTAPNSSPASVAATALVTGTVYQILTVGTSDFTLVGASANTVGTIFTATGTTTGTGTVSGQQGVEKGEQWLDTTGGTYVLKIYDGTDWRSESGTFVDVSGDTMTGDLVMNNANIVFEGATADDFETTLTVTDPTADRTITLPNVTGTVVTTGDTGTVTSTMIADGTIVNADVNASAAIAGTKIDPDFGSQTIKTTGVFSAADGAAATPSITFTSDTNTGIYRPGADQVAISTNGTQRINIEADGDINIDSGGVFYDATNNRLAIGTTSPGHNLEIKGSFPDFAISDSDTANDKFRILHNSGATQIQVDPNNVSASSHLLFAIDGTERMRIDSSGRLLVGTSSSSADARAIFQGSSSGGDYCHVLLARNVANPTSGSTLGNLKFTDSNHNVGAQIVGASDANWSSGSYGGRLVFSVTGDGSASPTEAFAITNDRRNWVFDARSLKAEFDTTAKLNVYSGSSTSTGNVGIECAANTGSARYHIAFSDNTGVVGSISTSGGATAYNTSSDYRLKENVVPLTGAVDRVNQLQVHRFNFIANPDTSVDGFIAHEVQTVVPEAVTGEKDAVDANGKPLYQGIDQSKLVPLLTAALQEAVAKIESLEARLTAAGL